MATAATGLSATDQKSILDLGTSDKAVLDIVNKAFSDTGSAEERAQLQNLLEMRTNKATLFSNVYKTLSEASRSIIQNIRN